MQCLYLVLTIVVIQETSELNPDILKYDDWIKDAEATVKRIKTGEKRRVEYVINKDTYIHDKRETDTASGNRMNRINVDLMYVGYNSTWDDFCNTTVMAKDFAGYPDGHDVMRFRRMLCSLKDQDKLGRESISVFATYKLCESVRPKIEEFYNKLRTKFDEHIAKAAEEMPITARPSDKCYVKTLEVFHRECMGNMHPCHEMFQTMLSGVCVKPGITKDDITRYIVDVCSGNYIDDSINWPSEFRKIPWTAA